MSKLFETRTSTIITPRQPALVRVSYYPIPPGRGSPTTYREAELWEFHPDYDNRMKFRGEAYLKPEAWMEHDAYERRGVGYLPDEQVYVAVREFMIHEQDRQELYRYCIDHNQRKPLIIHPCPLPFPLFKKGDRVVCGSWAPSHR